MKGKNVEIKYSNLYVTEYVGKDDEMIKSPIKNMLKMEEPEGEHIHGYLAVTIGDRKINNLGYFGEDDVCFNDWIGHLKGIIKCFSKSSQCRFLFYDGGQGDDAFEFCRDKNFVYISQIDIEAYYSITNAEIFDSSKTEQDKEAIICEYKDFDFAVRDFLKRIKKDIFLELGDFASVWWKENTASTEDVCVSKESIH